MADIKRKFTRTLQGPGSAVAIRQAIKDIRQSSNLNKSKLVAPLDYENVLVKNKIFVTNDLLKELLVFPPDDVTKSELPRRFRTIQCSVPLDALEEAQQLLVKESIIFYTSKWHMIHYKYNAYSNGYQHLPSFRNCQKVSLPQQVFEVDLETEIKDEDNSLRIRHLTVTKKGWMLIGSDSSHESGIVSTRSFKKRYFYLKQQADFSYVLEYHKDDKRMETKGSIFLDSAIDVKKNSKKGKNAFEIQMQDNEKPFYSFMVDSEAELDDWMITLQKAIKNSDVGELICEKNKGLQTNMDDSFCNLLEFSKKPEHQYSQESEAVLSKQRRSEREKLFALYPESQQNSFIEDGTSDGDIESDIFKEQFGSRFILNCSDLRLRLQANILEDGQPDKSDLGLPEKLDNPEPFFVIFSVYDADKCKKISEDFHFNPNSPEINNMIPEDILKDNSTPSNFTCRLPDPLWLHVQKTAVFSISNPHGDVYLVVRIEKILQGSINAALDNYLKTTDIKTGTKLHRSMKMYCQRLGRYRMPFAWGVRPLFRKYSQELDTTADFVIYKADGSRMCEEEIIKQIQDMRRTDKQLRLQPIQGVMLKVNVVPFKATSPNTITTSLLGVRPSEDSIQRPPTREVDEFVPEDGQYAHPFTTYINHLYVYPKFLKYDNQKVFTKARNIACRVEIRDSDEEAANPLKIIYDSFGQSLFTTSATTSVLHHNTTPDFLDEMKILLPVEIHAKHHLLFTFYHVGCDLLAKSTSKKPLVETAIGFAWFPICVNGRINVGEHCIKVAINFTPGYLSFEHQGSGRGSLGPDIKWIDGGRQIFKFVLRLVSSVHTKDQHLHNFFTHCNMLKDCQQSEQPKSIPDKSKNVEAEQNEKTSRNKEKLTNFVKSLHEVDIGASINFLPQLLNQILHLLVHAECEDYAINAVRVLIHIVTQICQIEKSNILHSYVKYVFVTEICDKQQRTIHEELAQHLKAILRPNMADQLVVGKFLKHSRFFFDILIKSMAQYLLSTERIKMARNERFPSSYQFHIETLVQSLCQHIVQKYKESPEETHNANNSLAHFVKKCLTFMDRRFVFTLINVYIENINLLNIKLMHQYKFEFLRIVCNHEHYIPLNLPFMKKPAKSLKDATNEFTLTDDFIMNHFMVGLLLSELQIALTESHDIRKVAIITLRNLLAKHSFDDRYSKRIAQERIAALYLPFISILIENKSRLISKEMHEASLLCEDSQLSRDDISGHSNTLSGSFNSQLSLDQTSLSSSVSSSMSSISQQRVAPEPSVFSLISTGQVVNPQVNLENQMHHFCGSSNSVASTISAQSISTEKSSIISTAKDFHEKYDSISSIHSSATAGTSATATMHYDNLNKQEIKDLLICFLFIVNNLSDENLLGWLNNSGEGEVWNFLEILEICMNQFKYAGKKRITNLCIIGNSRNSVVLPGTRKSVQISNQACSNMDDAAKGASLTEGNSQATIEANLAVEVAMIVLDAICLYANSFKDGDSPLMYKIFNLYLQFLQTGQSEKVQKHAFAALRMFVNKFTMVLFCGKNNVCGKLCYELLRCCSSRLDSTRAESCALLYFLIRKNFEFSEKKGCARVRLQMIISVSQLISNNVVVCNARFIDSLSIISSYATSDKSVQNTAFPVEVRDLTKCIRTVLMATSAMKEHKNNPEMLIDLQHNLAKSYASNPELRKTWLESMAKFHENNSNYSEAGHCYIHMAAMIAEQLKRQGELPQGCTIFRAISPNIESEELSIRDDYIVHNVVYTEDQLVECLAQSAALFEEAERYELLGDVYRIILPIHEKKRDFVNLAKSYEILHRAYTKIVEVMSSKRRMLGKYFRVAFFGQMCFDDEDGKEYVYKEPKVTGLTEICDRLFSMYSAKFGKGNVKLIKDSKKVILTDLDPKLAYIQVTHVTPYFDEKELENRQTEFERNNNLRKFMFETPFTKSGKNRGEIEEQYKRRTIITTSHSFPYVTKRIQVLYHSEEELTPIEVAIDEMKNKTFELNDVVYQQPTDLKKLQLKLQGCVSAQVNAGPLAYAEAFLAGNKILNYKKDKVGALKEHFCSFVETCKEALEINGRLVSSDQFEYHDSLYKSFTLMSKRLEEILGQKLIEDDECSLASIQSTA